MESYDATRIVFSRIQSMEPENVSKIIGYLLLQGLGEDEMMRLAFGSNAFLQSMISKAKKDLELYSQLASSSVPHQLRWEILHPQPDHRHNFINLSRHQSLPSDLKFSECYQSQNQQEALNLVPYIHGNHHRRSYSMTDVGSSKPCVYFARGYCKHGISCRFSHGYEVRSGGDSGPPLEALECELQELLRGRRSPVSIASLPQLYYERFGKVLQADGYLTESQRHGKSGYSLTNLLARLKNTITVIDRPHGQHAVVLAEDAQRFKIDRDFLLAPTVNNSGCRQIYMTFPAESTFTEQDVSNYFRIYGPVQDVRIPYQQKRMFGFVTYVFSETVKLILSKGNPHYVCGARVLVKPYKERVRKNVERSEPPRCLPPSCTVEGKAHDFLSAQGAFQQTRKPVEEQEHARELERLSLADLRISEPENQSFKTVRSNFSNAINADEIGSADTTTGSEDLNGFDLQTEQFRYLLDVLDSEQNDNYESNGQSPAENPLGISNAAAADISLRSQRKSMNFSLLNDPIRELSSPKEKFLCGADADKGNPT